MPNSVGSQHEKELVMIYMEIGHRLFIKLKIYLKNQFKLQYYFSFSNLYALVSIYPLIYR